jgi:lipoate-protein ligase B
MPANDPATTTPATSPPGLEIIDWGRTDYRDALARQLVRVTQRQAGSVPDALIFTEHNPVYTTGARRDAMRHLLWDPATLRAAGIELVATSRGGDITYHGPGQIVGYPIVSLHARRDLHAYLRAIEEALIRTVAHFGLSAARRPGLTGIWIGPRKLAAIGVAVRQWVTYHGFALNVCPELGHFAGIVPCGITDGSVTSLAVECPRCPPVAEVKGVLSLEFRAVMAKGE